MKKTIFILFLSLAGCLSINAQTLHFIHHYADKLNINPAFAASGTESEIDLTIRNQWTGIDKGFKMYSAEYLQKVPAAGGGFGIGISGCNSGKNTFVQNTFTAVYAYKFNLTRNIKICAASGAAYHQKSINAEDAIYYSMIDPVTGNSSGLSQSAGVYKYGKINFCSGIIGYTKKYMAGISAYNMISMKIKGEETENYPIISAIFNRKITLKKEDKQKSGGSYLIPGIIFTHCEDYNTLRCGIYFAAEKFNCGADLDCRTGKNYKNFAVCNTVGYRFEIIEINLGYELEIGSLQRQTYGAAELTIKYKFLKQKKIKGDNTIICPAF